MNTTEAMLSAPWRAVYLVPGNVGKFVNLSRRLDRSDLDVQPLSIVDSFAFLGWSMVALAVDPDCAPTAAQRDLIKKMQKKLGVAREPQGKSKRSRRASP